jgi:hypothetical protein
VLKQEGRNRMNELAIANIIGHKNEWVNNNRRRRTSIGVLFAFLCLLVCVCVHGSRNVYQLTMVCNNKKNCSNCVQSTPELKVGPGRRTGCAGTITLGVFVRSRMNTVTVSNSSLPPSSFPSSFNSHGGVLIVCAKKKWVEKTNAIMA